MKQKVGFYKMIKKIGKPLANLTKKRRDKTQINKIRDEKGDITTNTKEIQRIIREHCKNLYSKKLENLEEMNTFLDAYDQPNLNHENINQSRSIRSNEIEATIVSQRVPGHRTSVCMGGRQKEGEVLTGTI
jgi:hypothetical protein